MEYYEKLPYRELQQEAKKLGVKPLRVTRQTLLKQIEIILNKSNLKKEKEQDFPIPDKRQKERKNLEPEPERRLRQEPPFIPAKRQGPKSQDIIRKENPTLHDFLSSTIDGVPGIDSNPWDIVFDELNTMSKEQSRLLQFLINIKEHQIPEIMGIDHKEIFALFNEYPVLLYATILRIIPEDPWISLIIVSSGAHHLYPSSQLLKHPIYDDLEKLHPFARLVISAQEGNNLDRTTYLCWLHIRYKLGYDENSYLVFLKLLLEAIIINDSSFLIEEHGREMSNEDSQKYLPLTEDILNSYLRIYEELRNEDRLTFVGYINKLILSTKRKIHNTYVILKFVKSGAFSGYIEFLLEYIPFSPDFLTITHTILLMERITPTFASVVKNHIRTEEKQYYIENNFSSILGRKIVDLFITDSDVILIYAENLSILSQYLNLNLSLLLEELFSALSKFPKKKKILINFLSVLIMNISTVQGRSIMETIKRDENIFNRKDKQKLKKMFSSKK